MISGVFTKELRVIADERGRLCELYRKDWEGFKGFGQAYITTAYPGVVKAWHKHEHQTDTFVCVKGMVKVVLCDQREKSSSCGRIEEYYLGEHAPKLLRIPKGVWHGYKCISESEAIIINFPDKVYNYEKPDEKRYFWNGSQISYDWGRKNG